MGVALNSSTFGYSLATAADPRRVAARGAAANSVRSRDIPLGAAVRLPQRGRRMVIRWYAANKVGEFHAQV